MAVTTPASTRVAERVGVRQARSRRPHPGTALVVALVAACTYAVFAHGAAGLPLEPRLQIGVAFVSIGAAVGWLFSRTLSVRAPAEAWIGVGLLAGFAVWCAVTLLWSVAPDDTWAALNRGVAYTLVVVLAIAAGSSATRAIERVAYGWLLVAVACVLYALAGKVMPAVHVLGVDFNHTSVASRLRDPLQYWNALALVAVLAAPIALRLTTDDVRRPAVRFAALAALFGMLCCLGMTYSRGGLLALVAAIAVMTLLGGQRLRGLAVLGTTIVMLIPPLALAFSRPALKGIHVPLHERTADGIVLGMVLAGSLTALMIAGWGLLRLEQRTRWSDESTRLVWRGLGAISGVLALIVVFGIATSKGGPGRFFDDAWHEFTKTSQDKDSDPARIVSSNSGNRWVWWQEAAGAWSDRPLQGWGAGSFPVTHLMYRKVELDVQQPHSVPLQFLAETGVVGATLGMGALGFLLFAALARVRSMRAGRERDLAVALFAGAVAWLVHGFVDFDWDIPGVTVPALLFVGVLVAIPARRDARGAVGVSAADQPGGAVGPRAAALALACVVLGVVMVSALLPEWADSKASSALAISTTAREPELRDAAAKAEASARLDPTAIRSLLAAADLAQNRGRLLDARRYLLQAVDRQPYSVTAWRRLMNLALDTADRRGARAAARRLLELDPIGKGTLALVGRLVLFSVPASGSPTATGTPLSPAYAAATTAPPTPQTDPAAGIPQTPLPGGGAGSAVPGVGAGSAVPGVGARSTVPGASAGSAVPGAGAVTPPPPPPAAAKPAAPPPPPAASEDMRR
jgi:O-antigen ligase